MNIIEVLQKSNYAVNTGNTIENSPWPSAYEYFIYGTSQSTDNRYWTNFVRVAFNSESGEVYTVSVQYNGACYCWMSDDDTETALEWYTPEDDEFEVDEPEDILEKVEALVKNLPFDTRILVKLDLPEDVIELIHTMALEKSITVDEMVEEIIRSGIMQHNESNSNATN